MSGKLLIIVAVLILICIICSCAAGPNKMVKTQNKKGDKAGFFTGFWHGMISLFTFIISLFTDNVNIYEVHNNGNWYDLGFVIGAGILFGGGGAACNRS